MKVVSRIISLFLLTAATGLAAESRPNVLLIVIDDLNDWASCMDVYPDANTPNIDRLAQTGMLFTNAYCTTAQCGPSRTAMLTGLDANTTGLYWNEDHWKKRFPGLQSMPILFRKAGYGVYGTGKIFHGNTPEEIRKYHFPKDWDDYFIPSSSPDPRKGNQSIHALPGIRPFYDWGPVDAPDEEMRDSKIASWGSEVLKRTHDKPFFLAVGFHKPHLPWYVPRKYFDGRPVESITRPPYKEDDLADVPSAGNELAPNEPVHRRLEEKGLIDSALSGYLAAIDFVDLQVGRVLDALDESGQADKTIVVLWTDHGYHLGEKDHWSKHRLWERATKTLLIIRAPGKTQPGSKFTGAVSALDIFPTLAQLCDLPNRKYRFDGYSLVPAFTNPDWQRPRPVLTTQAIDNYAVRDDRYRYIRYRDGSEELYDHENDPNEWTNLADEPEHADVKKRLADYLPSPETKAPRKQKDFDNNPKYYQELALMPE